MNPATGLLSVAGAALLIAVTFGASLVHAQNADRSRHPDRFHHNGGMDNEATPRRFVPGEDRVREAPTGFDNLTNGFDPQGPAFDTLTAKNVVAKRSFNDNRFIFEEFETVA